MPDVTLCNCSDDPRKVSKTLTGGGNYPCTIYSDCSVHNPRILLVYSSGLENYNYAHFLNRYYWIRDAELQPGNRIVLTLEEDVLFTHAAEIRNIDKFRVVRNEHVAQPHLVDGEYPVLVTNNIKREYFSNKNVFAGQSYLLTVLGGHAI